MKVRTKAMLSLDEMNVVLYVPFLRLGWLRLLHFPCIVNAQQEMYESVYEEMMTFDSENDSVTIHDPVNCFVEGDVKFCGLSELLDIAFSTSHVFFTIDLTSFRYEKRTNLLASLLITWEESFWLAALILGPLIVAKLIVANQMGR